MPTDLKTDTPTSDPHEPIERLLLRAALFYGDAIITPAISVLSAVEGLKSVPGVGGLVSPAFILSGSGLYPGIKYRILWSNNGKYGEYVNQILPSGPQLASKKAA